jgi:hypothetical protein
MTTTEEAWPRGSTVQIDGGREVVLTEERRPGQPYAIVHTYGRPGEDWSIKAGRLTPCASVAEYSRTKDGILFRVIHVPEHGIVYVLRDRDGQLAAETFEGRKMAEVPPFARAAVERYRDADGKL